MNQFSSAAEAAAHLSGDENTRDRVNALSAYTEGYDAFVRGIDETRNPYDLETEEKCHFSWNDGYMAAEAEAYGL